MASDKEHLICANCFINGLVKKIGYSRDQIYFVNSDKLPAILNKSDQILLKEDVSNDIKKAIVLDDSLFTSQYGILLPLIDTGNGISTILIAMTISYIWKRNDDIEYYFDNVKEPYTVHSSAIIHYIENVDLNRDNIQDLVFELSNSDKSENLYSNYYDLIAQKINKGEIEEIPLTLDGKKLYKIQYLSSSK